MVEELVPDPFIQNQNSLDQQSAITLSLFLWYVQVEVYQNTSNLSF